jgi:hypothetical protein
LSFEKTQEILRKKMFLRNYNVALQVTEKSQRDTDLQVIYIEMRGQSL